MKGQCKFLGPALVPEPVCMVPYGSVLTTLSPVMLATGLFLQQAKRGIKLTVTVLTNSSD